MKNNAVFVNGQNLNLQKMGGAGKYGKQLYIHLMELKKELLSLGIEVSLVNFNDISEQRRARETHSRQYINIAKDIISQYCPSIFFDILNNSLIKKKEKDSRQVIYRLAKKNNKFIIHEITNYKTIDEIGRLCLCSKMLLTVTFLDIQDFFYPEHFTDKILSYRRLSYSFYKERADLFFAVSNFTKQTMVEFLGIPSDKIIVTYLAANDLFLFNPSVANEELANSFNRYWIYPAKAWIHKNHVFLLQAIGEIKEILHRNNIKLLLTGGFNNADVRNLKKNIYENKLHNIVHILGFVPEEQLHTLIKRAEYLIFPSLFEGFGMPILEAMTLGCPVISSNAGSLPEIGGDAAIYFDPKNKNDFVSLLESLITEKGINRKEIIQKGYENCKRFSWNDTCRKTVEIYNKLLQ